MRKRLSERICCYWYNISVGWIPILCSGQYDDLHCIRLNCSARNTALLFRWKCRKRVSGEAMLHVATIEES